MTEIPLEERTLETDKLSEFIVIVNEWRNRWDVGEHAVYRGHTDFNWILIPKLFRDPNVKRENRKGDDPLQIEQQLQEEHLKKEEAHKIERRLFDDFSRYLYSYRPDLICTLPEDEKSNARAMQEWRQLAIAQHYGLPTRLLDFTTNMLVALFFAVEKPAASRKTSGGQWQEQDSAVWCIEVPNRRKVWEIWKKDGVWLGPLDFAEQGSDPPIANFTNTAFVPEHIDERMEAQGSIFMCEPRGKRKDWTLHVGLRDKTKTDKGKTTLTLKVRIPKGSREHLREELDLVGINRATLFPDLESVAKYLTWAVHQLKKI